MGFIEEMEKRKQQQTQEELDRKTKLEAQRQVATQQEQSRRLEEKREKERLLGLQKESELKFNESGVPNLLRRLIGIGSIDYFNTEERDDGMYGCKVTKSSRKIGSISRRGESGYSNVYINRIFRIKTDSTGTITFQYGTIWPHEKTIEQSVWKGSPYILEELLEKAYKSPSREREELYVSPPQNTGR